ncbi:hypothetical protein [Caulobacter sp. NIBR1757]|uniref:hypothetical protein n=1 Tax=Caulobacter sp. NIBR1757 TaxID=3016000 RepID=UPI0022F028DB|nr:hypothetical protein [Caulobacter sp. NIBR1757]
MRIIGHDCGHDFFGDSYANALRNHEEETAEESARRLLLERLPDLARTLLEAVTVAKRLRALLDFRERAFSTITFAAVASMRRTRIGDQLTVDVESPATDDRGLRLVERIKVSSVGGLDMLMPRSGVLAALMKSIQIASLQWTPMGEDRHESLRAMTRQEAFGAAKAVRDLDVALTNARATHEGLVQLLAPTGLLAMAQWGQHGQCPKPFWIEIVGDRVYLSKGVRPRYWDRRAFLPLPGDENYQLVVVK